MTGSLKDKINRMADIAAIDHQAMKLLNEAEMKEYRKITAKYDRQASTEIKQFHDNYNERFEQARRKLIDEAGSFQWAPKPSWAAPDRFNSDAIAKNAQRKTHGDHHKKLTSIDAQRFEDCSQFIKLSAGYQSLKRKPKTAFKQATNRRRGEERRMRRSIGRS